MGLLKNLFYYSVGKSLSKNHSDAAGFGLMSLNILNEQLNEQEKNKKDFEKGKIKAVNSFKEFYMNNQRYFGNDYLREIYKYQTKLLEMTPENSHITTNLVQSFLKEMEFHIEATSGSIGIIEELEKLPREKMKPNFLINCKNKVNLIKNSIVPLETLNYWEDFMNYLAKNNVDIENRDSVKEHLLQMLK